MLPAQACNVAEASLRPLPTVKEFLDRLDRALLPSEGGDADVALFGETFASECHMAIPQGTHKTQVTACQAAKDFQKVLDHQGIVLPNLDEWFRAFPKFVLHPSALFEDDPSRTSAMVQRKALCASVQVVCREWLPQTLTTYKNFLCKVYKRTRPTHGIVTPSD